MPIIIPSGLPAHQILADEGVMVMSVKDASRQDIRPLEIGMLNLMPDKPTTETQFARLIGATPLQINLTLFRMATYTPKNTHPEHLEEFYQTFHQIRDAGRKFDGIIITGAPVELLDYEDVSYWDEFMEILDWIRVNVHSTIGVCWAGMAMLYNWYGIPKHTMTNKASGCYRHRVSSRSAILRGLNDEFVMPVSRWTSLMPEDILSNDGLDILIEPLESEPDCLGPCLVHDRKHRSYMIFNHFEYDWDTLLKEYTRDLESALETRLPVNYFPDDNIDKYPTNRWRCHGHQFYGNWINDIYQHTPFDIDLVGRVVSTGEDV